MAITLKKTWKLLRKNYLDDSEVLSYGQLVIGSFIMTTCLLRYHILCSVFWWNIKSPRWLSPPQPRFSAQWLLAFSQTKITFEREDISDHPWDSGKHSGVAHGDWENCVRSQGAYLEGDWGVTVLCTLFLAASSIHVSIFHITLLDTFWTDLIYHIWLIHSSVDGYLGHFHFLGIMNNAAMNICVHVFVCSSPLSKNK